MSKKFILQKEMKNLLSTGSYYFKYNRVKFEKNKFEENYHSIALDPDGKKRNLILEKKYKLKQINEIINFLKKQKPGKILDIGCGHGWLLSTLNNKWKKFGLDVSKFALKSASKYAEIFLGDIKDFNKEKFDFISALHIIEHHSKPERLIKKIYKILKPGGTLILETPDFDSAAARRFGNNFRMLKDKTHISLFSQDSLIRFIRDNKFKIFQINYPYFDTPFFNKKNLLKIFNKKKISPPFYGSVITIFCKKI